MLEESSKMKRFLRKSSSIQIIINNKHIQTYNELEQWLAFNNPDEDF